MIENICLIIEYIFLVILALSIIFGIIMPLFVIIFSFLGNLLFRLKTGKKELILGHYGAPFVLMIGVMLAFTSLALSLLVDVMVTQYYYSYLIIY